MSGALVVLLLACGDGTGAETDEPSSSGTSMTTGSMPQTESISTTRMTSGLDESSTDPSPGGPPQILEITAIPSELTEGDVVSVSVQATDPDGLDDIVGGTLTSPDGDQTYGVLEQIAGGTFTVSLSWAQLHATVPIEFSGSESRTLRVELIDAAALTASDTVLVTLSCREGGACDGECVSVELADNCGDDPPIDEQPADGMYSECATIADCFGLTTCVLVPGGMAAGYCSNTGCVNALIDCDPNPGATSSAVPECVDNGIGAFVCALGCSGGLTCPGGMDCLALGATMVCA